MGRSSVPSYIQNILRIFWALRYSAQSFFRKELVRSWQDISWEFQIGMVLRAKLAGTQAVNVVCAEVHMGRRRVDVPRGLGGVTGAKLLVSFTTATNRRQNHQSHHFQESAALFRSRCSGKSWIREWSIGPRLFVSVFSITQPETTSTVGLIGSTPRTAGVQPDIIADVVKKTCEFVSPADSVSAQDRAGRGSLRKHPESGQQRTEQRGQKVDEGMKLSEGM